MMVKWVWDETTKLSQYWRYQSWDSLGEWLIVNIRPLDLEAYWPAGRANIESNQQFLAGDKDLGLAPTNMYGHPKMILSSHRSNCSSI